MKILILCSSLLISLSSFSCPKLQGTWRSCQVSSSLLNPIEIVGANIILKSYTFRFSNPGPNTLRSEIFKPSIFGGSDSILNNDSTIGQNNKTNWEKNLFKDSTAPELTTYLRCETTGMTEYITWDNLSVENYPDHATENYPKYYKTVYVVSGTNLTRYIYSKVTLDGEYTYLAKLKCTK